MSRKTHRWYGNTTSHTCCGVTGKRCHMSRKSAREHKKVLERRGGQNVCIYLCKDCRCLHVGHSTSTRSRRSS